MAVSLTRMENDYYVYEVKSLAEIIAVLKANNSENVKKFLIDLVEDDDGNGAEITPSMSVTSLLYSSSPIKNAVLAVNDRFKIISRKNKSIKNYVIKLENASDAFICFRTDTVTDISGLIENIKFSNITIKGPGIVFGGTNYNSTYPFMPVQFSDCLFDFKIVTEEGQNYEMGPFWCYSMLRCNLSIDLKDCYSEFAHGALFNYTIWIKECLITVKNLDSTRPGGFPAMFWYIYNTTAQSPFSSRIGGWHSHNMIVYENLKLPADDITHTVLNTVALTYRKLWDVKIVFNSIDVSNGGHLTINDKATSENKDKNFSEFNCFIFVEDSVKDYIKIKAGSGATEDQLRPIYPESYLKDVEKLKEIDFFKDINTGGVYYENDTDLDVNAIWHVRPEVNHGYPTPNVPPHDKPTDNIRDIYIGGDYIYEIYLGDTCLWRKRDTLKQFGLERLQYYRMWKVSNQEYYNPPCSNTLNGPEEVIVEVTPYPLDTRLNQTSSTVCYPFWMGPVAGIWANTKDKYVYFKTGNVNTNFHMNSGTGGSWGDTIVDKYRMCLHDPRMSYPFTCRSSGNPTRAGLNNTGRMNTYSSTCSYELGSQNDYTRYGSDVSMLYFGFKIYDYNTLVCDLVPAYRKKDNKTGFFDYASYKFYEWQCDSSLHQKGLDFAGPYIGSELYDEMPAPYIPPTYNLPEGYHVCSKIWNPLGSSISGFCIGSNYITRNSHITIIGEFLCSGGTGYPYSTYSLLGINGDSTGTSYYVLSLKEGGTGGGYGHSYTTTCRSTSSNSSSQESVFDKDKQSGYLIKIDIECSDNKIKTTITELGTPTQGGGQNIIIHTDPKVMEIDNLLPEVLEPFEGNLASNPRDGLYIANKSYVIHEITIDSVKYIPVWNKTQNTFLLYGVGNDLEITTDRDGKTFLGQ